MPEGGTRPRRPRPPRLQNGGELERFVAGAGGVALVVVYGFAVWTQTLLGFVAPKKTIAGVRNGGVPFRLDVHTFPAQQIATVVVELRE